MAKECDDFRAELRAHIIEREEEMEKQSLEAVTQDPPPSPKTELRNKIDGMLASETTEA